MTKKDIIYFVPGIMCSTLLRRSDRKVVWSLDHERLLVALGRPQKRFLADDLIPGEVIRFATARIVFGTKKEDVYGGFLIWLAQKFPNADIKPFAYDWRQSNLSSAKQLHDSISAHAKNAERVFLVGHSMGGLVALLARELLSGSDAGKKINKIVNIGTPHMGSAKAFRTLLEGYPRLHDFIDGWLEAERRQQRFAPEHLANDVRTFDSIYELLPSTGTTFTQAGVAFPAVDRDFWKTRYVQRVDAAVLTHDKLRKTDQTEVFTIYSSLNQTETHYEVDSKDQIVAVLEKGRGDGTVTAVSAQGWTRPACRQPLTAAASHSLLPRHAETRSLLMDMLSS